MKQQDHVAATPATYERIIVAFWAFRPTTFSMRLMAPNTAPIFTRLRGRIRAEYGPSQLYILGDAWTALVKKSQKKENVRRVTTCFPLPTVAL
jgi:hypothetical protein